MLQGGSYPSDLSEHQWELIKEWIPHARRGGRKRTTDVRKVISAIFYLNRSGCAWRYLPKEFPPWQTVYDYFSTWKLLGIWKRIHELLRTQARLKEQKNAAASALIIDSQSIRAPYGESRGYDGFKRLRGRKRHILVDTLGFVHAVKVHAANQADSTQGHHLFERSFATSRLQTIFADHGYRGEFVKQTKERFGFYPTIPALRKDSGQGIRKTTKEKRANRKLREVPKKRWIVERTFAWLNHYRRLSKDYERKTSHSESMIELAMTQLLLRRLVPKDHPP